MEGEIRVGERKSRARRLAAIYRKAVLVCASTLLVLILFDALAAIALRLASRDLPDAAALPYYVRQPWGVPYWQEQHDRDLPGSRRYEPFALWRSHPFEGEWLNVDAAGVRRTPGSACGEGAFQLLAFGGSTMWSVGAPDAGTIPALLVREAEARRKGRVCAVNLAEMGFVSTQGMITLVRQLQAGVRPDAVVFYDGINDVVAAAESGQAGVHQGLQQIAARLERRRSPLADLLFGSKLAEAINRLRIRLVGQPRYPSHFDAAALGAEVSRAYLVNHSAVQALAREFGFEAFFFWQPVISLDPKPLTPFEQVLRESVDPSVARLFEESYRRVQEAAPLLSRLFYIADVFEGIEAELYADPYHVTPEGNAVIARRMADLAWGPIPAGRGAAAGG